MTQLPLPPPLEVMERPPLARRKRRSAIRRRRTREEQLQMMLGKRLNDPGMIE